MSVSLEQRFQGSLLGLAMAGAISGAYLGVEAIPKRLLDRLEESPKGKTYLWNLASRLLLKYQERSASQASDERN